jgi:hypothetical protein
MQRRLFAATASRRACKKAASLPTLKSLGCKIEWIMRNSASVLNELPDR